MGNDRSITITVVDDMEVRFDEFGKDFVIGYEVGHCEGVLGKPARPSRSVPVSVEWLAGYAKGHADGSVDPDEDA